MQSTTVQSKKTFNVVSVTYAYTCRVLEGLMKQEVTTSLWPLRLCTGSCDVVLYTFTVGPQQTNSHLLVRKSI